MGDFDLDRLGDVWRQQPDPAEMQRLQRTAIAVARRARFSAILDVFAAVAVAAVVIFLVATNPKPQTMVMGSAAILILLGSNIRLRKLRRVELKGLTGTTEEMLDQSITRLETTVRHHKFTLVGTPIVFLVSWLFAATVAPRREMILGRFAGIPLFRAVLFGVSVSALLALAVFLIVSIRRGRAELGRLKPMRDAYRSERTSTEP